MHDAWHLERYQRGKYLLCTGWDDQCLGFNQELARILGDRVPHELWIWETYNSHDWPTWALQMQHYL